MQSFRVVDTATSDNVAIISTITLRSITAETYNRVDSNIRTLNLSASSWRKSAILKDVISHGAKGYNRMIYQILCS